MTTAQVAQAEISPTTRSMWQRVLVWFVAPAIFYLIFTYVFEPQALAHFSNRFYLDKGDGFQNVWNIWWVHHAVVDLHQNPFYTTMLHAPKGVTLIGHTLNIFNGLLAIPLSGIGLSLIQRTNTVIVFSFIMGGVTAFWLLRYLSCKYPVSLFGGFLFTFSSYHFAHAIGHLQLVSLEWVPLFFLVWLRLLDRPTRRRAAAVAGVLFLVVLCDYYYLLYCIIGAAIIIGMRLARREFKFTKTNLDSLATLCLLALASSGVIVGSLLIHNHNDPFGGGHPAAYLGLDIVSIFLPGANSHWSSLTGQFTINLNVASEASMYLGLSLLVPLAVAFAYSKKLRLPGWLREWWLVFWVFLVLSLGPRLRFNGRLAKTPPFPYALLERLVPGLRLSGVPARMTVMVVLAAVVIGAQVLNKLDLSKARPVAAFVFIWLFAVVELYPQPIPLNAAPVPDYVRVLKQLPDKGAVIDLASGNDSVALLYQTLHERPMAFGYVSRVPRSVEFRDVELQQSLIAGQLDEICAGYGLRYLATAHDFNTGLPVIYRAVDGTNVHIYDLKNSARC